MSDGGSGTLQEEGAAALKKMEEALELLDRCGNAIDVGAHLDLAICRLRDAIACEAPNPYRGSAGQRCS